MIRFFLSLLFCWALLPTAQAAPNFVILVGDGIGRDWMSCYGSSHQTPNLDALASEGIQFTVAWGSPDSVSTATTLTTGQYPHRHDSSSNAENRLLESLRASGYETASLYGEPDGTELEAAIQPLLKSDRFCLYYELSHSGNAPTSAEAYTDYVASIDQRVGQVLEMTEAAAPIVIFTSNSASRISGNMNGETYPESKGVNANWSAHVPLIVKAPEIIPEPRSRRDLIDASDLFPTVLELADVPVPDNHPIDGKSFVPVLRGSDDPFEKRNWIYAQSGNFRMMRDWHHYIDDSGAFHDLDKDPFQREEVSVQDKQAPHRRERLQMILDRFPKAGN